jgi:iron complex outermembrane recepter protein
MKLLSSHPGLLCLAASLALAPASVHAQAARPAAPAAEAAKEPVYVLSAFQVSTTADKGYLAGNSVSASRIDTPIKDLPFAVNAFTNQFIMDTGATDLFDVVRYAPGVTSAGKEFTGGRSIFAVRGFDQAPQRNGFTGNTYVDTVSIERVEIVKGPASVLYGQVAPGGTVNYITKRAGPRPFTNVNLTVGNHELFRTQVDVNRPIVGETVMARFNGMWQNGLEYIDPTGNTRDRSWVIAPTVTWHITPKLTLVSDYEWFWRHERVPQMFKMNMEVPGLANPIDSSALGFSANVPLGRDFNYASRNDYRRSQNESVNEELIWRADKWTVRAAFAYNRYRVSHKLTGGGSVVIPPPASYGTGTAAALAFAEAVRANPVVGLTAPTMTINRRVRFEESWGLTNTYQLEAVANYEFDWGSLKPLFGGFHSNNITQGRQRQIAGLGTPTPGAQGAKIPPLPAWDLRRPETIDYDTDFNEHTLPLAAFSQNVGSNDALYGVVTASTLEDRLQAVAGIRYHKAKAYSNNLRTGVYNIGADNKPSSTAPQLGIGYKITPETMLYASYSESFIVNNAALQNLGVPVGPAKPTTARGYEFGVKTSLRDGRISSTVSVFEIENSDRIISFNIFQGPIVVITTTQGTLDRSRGIEGDVTLSLTDNWQVYLSGSLIDVRVVKVPDPSLNIYLNARPEGTAKFLASMWSRYNFTNDSLKGYWLGVGINHTGRKAQRLQNPYLFIPSYTLFDVTVGKDWKWGRTPCTLNLSWKNIGDEEYFPANQLRGLPSRISAEWGIRF